MPRLEAADGALFAALAARFERIVVDAGQAILRVGEAADALYLVESGLVEVWQKARWKRVLIATLGPGAMFGEMGLLRADGTRQANVSAVDRTTLLAVSARTVRALRDDHPVLDAALAELADSRERALALALCPQLRVLDGEAQAELLGRMETLVLDRQDVLFAEGDAGDACYLVTRGALDLRRRGPDGRSRTVAVARPGSLLGEVALMTDAPRNASAIATEPTRLARLGRDAFHAVMGRATDAKAAVEELVRSRVCPRHRADVVVHERLDRDDQRISILKHPEGRYFQLSERGRFVWDRLDGTQALQDLTVAMLRTHRTMAAEFIQDLLVALARGGFVTMPGQEDDGGEQASRPRGLAGRIRRALEWRTVLRDVDPFFAALYRAGGRHAFTRAGAGAAALLLVAGLAAFLQAMGASQALWRSASLGLLASAWPLTILSIVLHELAHGLAVKAQGRDVLGVGVGWYWFGPMVFVDTSDMWLSDRRGRVLVSLAGPLANLLIGAVASLAALTVSGDAQAVLLLLALGNFSLAFLNLNPGLEFDGYYILMDLLETPNLRRKAMRWLGSELPGALLQPERLRAHRVELFYGLASLLFVLLTVVGMVAVNRVVLSERLATWLGETSASVVSWGLVLVVVGAVTVGLWVDLRGHVVDRSA